MKAWREGTATSPRPLRAKDMPMLKAAFRLGTATVQRTRKERTHVGTTPVEIVWHWTVTIGGEWLTVTRDLVQDDEELCTALGALGIVIVNMESESDAFDGTQDWYED